MLKQRTKRLSWQVPRAGQPQSLLVKSSARSRVHSSSHSGCGHCLILLINPPRVHPSAGECLSLSTPLGWFPDTWKAAGTGFVKPFKKQSDPSGQEAGQRLAYQGQQDEEVANHSSGNATLPGRTLYGVFQCFERPHLYHFARRFCLVDHRFPGEWVDAFVLARGRLVNDIDF